MSNISVRNLVKTFGLLRAVDGISFEVKSGTMVTLLGPSGCGKTTSLRLLAGLEAPDAGQIYLDDRLLSDSAQGIFVPPEKRHMGMVFQNYAVWPHMTIYENVVFPLQMLRVPKKEQRERVLSTLQMVGLGGLHGRPAPMLSGGQQQRVALARALVSEPNVLLLDEPLSNLDARLRDQMRFELRELQQKLKFTGIFVTHDQQEAMVISDDVIVMNAGRIEQEGGPLEVYREPDTRFVMDFMGETNYLDATVFQTGTGVLRARAKANVAIDIPLVKDSELRSGEDALISFRPEDVRVVPEADSKEGWAASIVSLAFLGRQQVEYILDMEGTRIQAIGHSRDRQQITPGCTVRLIVSSEDLHVWPSSAQSSLAVDEPATQVLDA